MTDFRFKPKTSKESFGWTVRKLRHFDGPLSAQFVTFRLFDSLPKYVIEMWRAECSAKADFRRRIERYLDNGHGECWLRVAEIASVVAGAITYHAGIRYDLAAWVIMPNHVHMLIRLYENQHLPVVLHSIKSFSAQSSNKILGRKGQFSQHESFDRYIRGPRHFAAVVKYIENNPVKTGLCSLPSEWQFSSAFNRAEPDYD
jgi:putative DNA methylase